MWRLTRVTLVLLICVKDSLSQPNVCGRPIPRLNPRIVGGVDASEGAWPWMVSLHNTTYQQHFCGGSLINSEWVLTAAHCVFGKDKNTLLVYLGKTTQEGNNPNEIIRTVNNIISHTFYNPGIFDNDIALLHLSSAVPFNDYIQPVCLAAQSSSFLTGTKGWITGWGFIGVQINTNPHINSYTVPVPLPAPVILQEAEVKVFEKNDCLNLCRRRYVTKNMICAGLLQGGRGHWEGDSGGPMVNKHCSQWVQSGVISHTYGCAQRNKPDGYTKVSEYQQWITTHIVQNPPGFVVFKHQTPCTSANQIG